MFKRWTETKSSTKQSSEPEQLHTSFLSTSLLTLVSESKDKPATPETKLGFNSWSLRGKEKAVETTGLPVVTPVTVTSIHAKAASSNGTTSSASTVLNAAGHLAGIVAAATSKPLVGKPVSGGHPILAPKLLGTARRIGLTTVANMARFAANLHQFSTSLRIIGPKDRKRVNAQSEVNAESTEKKEAGLGSEDSGIGDVSNDYEHAPSTSSINTTTIDISTDAIAATSNGSLAFDTKPTMAVLEELGNDNYSAATSSASKEELENTASAFLAISPSTTSNEVMEVDPVTQLANVMEAAFAFPSEQAEADKQVTAAIAESAIFNAIVESNAPIEHKIVSEIVRKDDTPTEHKIVSELAMDMTSVTIIAEDKNASDLAVAPELLEATDVETLSKIEQITSTMAEEKSEITPDDINDHIDNDHLSITILDRTSKDFSLLLPPTPALAPSLSNNDDIAIDNNNNDDDDDKAIIDTDVASSLAMPATVDITIVEVKSTKKSRWFSKVGSKLIQKQDKSAKSTTHSLEVETKTTLTKEKTLRKSIRHRFRGVSRRDHVEPTDDAVHALDSHSFTTSADASSKTDAETTNSPSSSDDDADTTSNLDKAAHRSTKSLEVPRARRWARDIGAVIRRHHSDSFVGESALKKTTSESGPSSSASPPQLRIDTKMANQNANEEDSDRISSASSSSSSSLPITPTTPTHNPNDMHCPSRRVAYLGSVRKLQDGRRPLREMIGVQSVLAEVRRVGGVRVPVREVHAALAAGDRDMARRRRRLSARRQATVSTDGALMPLNGTRAAADVSVSTTNGAGQQHRRSSSWSQSPSLPTLRRLPSMPLAMPLISFDTPPIKSPSPLKLATPMLANLTGSVTVPATHDYEEDDVPLALLRESSGHRSSLSA